MRRYGTWVVVLVVAGAAAVGFVSLSGSPLEVDSAVARYAPLRKFVEERGKTRLPNVYRITMPQTGRILPITLEEGDRVSKGDVVARMDPKDLDLAVREAEARIRRLEAEIVENDDDRLERSSLKQTEHILDSVAQMVEAAQEQTKSSKARNDFFESESERIRRLRERNAASETDLNRAEMDRVESWVNHQKDMLTLRANQAAQSAAKILPILIGQYIEKKELRRDVLEGQLAEAKVQLERETLDKQRGELVSPVSGVILNRNVSNQRVLSAGELLLEIGRLEDLQIEADLLSEDVVNVHVGDRADVVGAVIGDQPVQATVVRIYPRGFTKVSSLGVEQQRVTVVLSVSREDLNRLADEGRQLGSDFRIRLRIYTESKDRALIIPSTALVRDARGQWQVFYIREGSAVLTTVKTGLSNDRDVEILDGLQEGDRVILAPESSLADGQRVVAQQDVDSPKT